ncbi:hypothetical protein [Peribacillus simplex]|uniref:hypothetical protein n=1 Tax=Peribacillus simplex TaxID=1478 RepID=UPI0024C10A42|nr:hypothetical protein [Peribacillus simplex]WHY59148.1 hypothetical protein QNH43_13220 [Peribacillus simplex]
MLIGAEVRDSCGSSGTGETPQAFTPRRLTARPAESEHLEGKSTTPHYLEIATKYAKTAFLFDDFFILKQMLFLNREVNRLLKFHFPDVISCNRLDKYMLKSRIHTN